jgi:hypothetical protein
MLSVGTACEFEFWNFFVDCERPVYVENMLSKVWNAHSDELIIAAIDWAGTCVLVRFTAWPVVHGRFLPSMVSPTTPSL